MASVCYCVRVMDPSANPFAAFSLIVAPAILTNASSVLAMSTSNRLARAVDRARELSKQLEESADLASSGATRRMRELSAAEERAVLLLRALRAFYAGLGGFAATALTALLGAMLVSFAARSAFVFEIAAAATGVFAVAALVTGLVRLMRETRIAVRVLQERAASLRERAAKPYDLTCMLRATRTRASGVRISTS
ncbi:MAG TPA: DUF2721 domain-containing protein [Candidatus Binatia bacterium]|nr:DUF2721 domain-containing protein [Candidatus Binatia bacterium]